MDGADFELPPDVEESDADGLSETTLPLPGGDADGKVSLPEDVEEIEDQVAILLQVCSFASAF